MSKSKSKATTSPKSQAIPFSLQALRKYAVNNLYQDDENGNEIISESVDLFPLLSKNVSDIMKEDLVTGSIMTSSKTKKLTHDSTSTVYYPGSGNDLLSPFIKFNCSTMIAVNFPDKYFFRLTARSKISKSLLINTTLYNFLEDFAKNLDVINERVPEIISKDPRKGPIKSIDISSTGEKVTIHFWLHSKLRKLIFYHNKDAFTFLPSELKGRRFLLYLSAMSISQKMMKLIKPTYICASSSQYLPTFFKQMYNPVRKMTTPSINYTKLYYLAGSEHGTAKYLDQTVLNKLSYVKVDMLKELYSQDTLTIYKPKN